MLTQQIAEKIRTKVSSLISQELWVVDLAGQSLSHTTHLAPASVDLSTTDWAIAFSYGGNVVGYIVLEKQLSGHTDIAPLIKSIAELIMHQSLVLEQIPHQDERLDKFVYDLLNEPDPDWKLLSAEARLFDIELERPRIAIIVRIDDDVLTSSLQDPSSDRDIRVSRYKSNLSRALNSFYTSSRANIVAYLGSNTFCILKDILANDEDDSDTVTSVERFKKSLNAFYGIIKGELNTPATIGVGNYHEELTGLRQSYLEAKSAIELGSANWDYDKIYHIDDFGVVAPLLSGIDENNIYFSRDLLDKLGRNQEIIETLNAFFNYDMSLTRTADAMKIHRNTLVYRLDRIKEALGLDPRDFEDAMQIRLAILYTRFLEPDNAA
jgi:carbohydrate diacid regulator